MTFTKDDLRIGMICLHRNGEYSMVVRNTYENEDNIIFNQNSRTGLDEFDKYTFKWGETPQSDFEKTVDIIKIYEPFNICAGVVIFSTSSRLALEELSSNWKVVWEEIKTEEMTLEQICKALGKNIKIIK